MHTVLCKVIKANFDESRPLFSRIFLEISQTFEWTFVPPARKFERKLSWSIENLQYRAKVKRNELSSLRNIEELTCKGKWRSSNFRGLKTNTTTSVILQAWETFLLQCSLDSFLVCPWRKPSCKTEENIFTTKDVVECNLIWQGLWFNLTRWTWIWKHTSTCQHKDENFLSKFMTNFSVYTPMIKPYPWPCSRYENTAIRFEHVKFI